MKIKNNKVTLSLMDRFKIIVLKKTICTYAVIDELKTRVTMYHLKGMTYIEYNQ